MFDVIIPVFKTQPEHLHEAIDSVLAQTYQEFEIYISDGTPIDHELHSSKLLADYEDKRIHIIQQEGLGIADARNQATKAGTNPYVALLDSDDKWYDLKLESYMELLQEKPNLKFIWGASDVPVEITSPKGNTYNTIALGGYHREWEKTHPIHRWVRIAWCPLMTSTHVYKRETLEAVDYWDATHTMGEDTELNCKIAQRWPDDCWQYEGIVGSYRVHEGQTTKGGDSHGEESGITTVGRPHSFTEVFKALQVTEIDDKGEDYWIWLEQVMDAERDAGRGERVEYSLRKGSREIVKEEFSDV